MTPPRPPLPPRPPVSATKEASVSVVPGSSFVDPGKVATPKSTSRPQREGMPTFVVAPPSSPVARRGQFVGHSENSALSNLSAKTTPNGRQGPTVVASPLTRANVLTGKIGVVDVGLAMANTGLPPSIANQAMPANNRGLDGVQIGNKTTGGLSTPGLAPSKSSL